MARLSRFAAALAGLALAASASASQFFVFPVKEIEGLAPSANPASQALLDQGLVQKLFGGPAGQQAQRELVQHFVERLNAAYPDSVVHPRQVYDVRIGSAHKFVDDDSLQCKASPSVAVHDTYAVVLGITRASTYVVPKGENVEILVPVTLSVQFVRPSLAKVVYTLSETVYSPFRFSRREYESGAADTEIRKRLQANLSRQVGSLVASARQGFDPRNVQARLVARDGGLYVVDQGVETGFVKGEQVEARDGAGTTKFFDVLYAESGYAVLRPVASSVSVGDSLSFVFGSPGDDSRKPRLMPVLSSDPRADAVAELFAKDIGFKASFQLSPVDVHFAQTKELMTRAANCVTWQKLPSMAEASGIRKDTPDYFLRFSPAATPVATLAGVGGTKSSDLFHTLVTAQVVDKFGRVIYSGIGDNDYTVEKVNGEGLGVHEAQQISLKNATHKLAENFLANVRFAPRDFTIARVDNDRLWVKGLADVPAGEKLAFKVLHPLDAKVGGKDVLLDLDVGAGAGDPTADGGLVAFPYSAVNPALPRPRSGDLLRLYTDVPPSATRVVDCDEAAFVPPNNVAEAGYLVPLIRHAVYRSKKYASYVGDAQFYDDANRLLQQGMFELKLQRPASEVCTQPGYVVREDAFACDGQQGCKATVTIGVMARLKKGDKVEKSIAAGLRTEFTGVPSAQRQAYYGYKELSNGLSMQADLINKLNLN
jgi:hypothetical protein